MSCCRRPDRYRHCRCSQLVLSADRRQPRRRSCEPSCPAEADNARTREISCPTRQPKDRVKRKKQPERFLGGPELRSRRCARVQQAPAVVQVPGNPDQESTSVGGHENWPRLHLAVPVSNNNLGCRLGPRFADNMAMDAGTVHKVAGVGSDYLIESQIPR